MAIGMPKSKANIIIAICAVLLVGLGAVTVYLFKQNIDLRNNPESITQEASERIKQKIGQLYELPSDEEPTVAEIKDKEKLKDQMFFKNVENGDYIIIYPNNKTAILYRESSNKIINVGPIAIESQDQTQNQNQTQSQDQSQ